MAKTPRVYAKVPFSGYTASMYYRLALPLHWMNKLKYPITIDIDGGFDNYSPQERWLAMMTADIVFLYQQFGFSFHDLMRESRTWPPEPDKKTGEMNYAPAFFFDTDDDILSVLPLNDAFKNLGYKDHNGNPLPDGAKIFVGGPDGNPIPLWEDGVNINIAENRTAAEGWIATMRDADLITCTTPRCRDYVLREGVNPDLTHVFPNCIDFNEYPKIELRDHPDEVRILWQGSIAHREDLWPLRESFGRISEKYPQVKWVFWGVPFEWLRTRTGIPGDKVELLPWVHHFQYHTRLSTIGHDISIAPLHPYTFNQSRSAIKFYESSAVWNPAASLCQRTGEYQDVIVEGETGMLFDTPEEFETKLGALIEDATLRQTLASNAKDWVRTYRSPEYHVPKLFERWQSALLTRRERPVEPASASPLSKHKRNSKRGKVSNRKRK